MTENLVMVLVQGSTLMGVMKEQGNEKRLNKPRRFQLVPDQTNPKQGRMGAIPLPGNPEFVVLNIVPPPVEGPSKPHSQPVLSSIKKTESNFKL